MVAQIDQRSAERRGLSLTDLAQDLAPRQLDFDVSVIFTSLAIFGEYAALIVRIALGPVRAGQVSAFERFTSGCLSLLNVAQPAVGMIWA